MKDVSDKMQPFLTAMRVRRQEMGLSGREVSALAGKSGTWTIEIESMRKTANPHVGRLAEWATALDVAEFGLYVVVDGHFTSFPLIGEEEDGEEGVDGEEDAA